MTWREVKESVGRDAVATLVWLYVDELARLGGLSADVLGDPAIALDALADENGCIDLDILNKAEDCALQRYKDDYQFLLEPLTDATWERYMELCRELLGVIG